jgi:hypothetical protein
VTGEQHGRRVRPVGVVVAVLLVAAGAVALVGGLRGQESAPQPRVATSSAPAPGTTAEPPPAPDARALTLPASRPVRLDVPAIGVTSDLLELGLNPDGSAEVPPLARDSQAGWYRDSPTPGQVGPAVILGHVDSAEYGPAVFFRLGDLRPGDEVSVARADGTTGVFRVDRVESYRKDAFPTLEVYGNTDRPELRLITCGGEFDPASRNYLSNIVVYASLTGSHPT